MLNVLCTFSVDHLLVLNEEVPFTQSSGVALLSEAVVVGHTTDPELGNLFTLRITFLTAFLIADYVFTHNVIGSGVMKLIDKQLTHVDLQINWIAGFSLASTYGVALTGL